MATNPGDEKHEHGDYVRRSGNSDVSLGEAVESDGAGGYQALTEGGTFLGVKYQEGEAGNDYDTVATDGVFLARVASDVADGEELGSPDVTNGEEAGTLDNAIDAQSVVALEDASQDYDDTSDYHAWVLVR